MRTRDINPRDELLPRTDRMTNQPADAEPYNAGPLAGHSGALPTCECSARATHPPHPRLAGAALPHELAAGPTSTSNTTHHQPLPCGTASAASDLVGRSGGDGRMGLFSEEWWAARGQVGRCTAHNVDGSRHRLPALKGATVCRRHGGAAPQVKAAAARRLARATALQWASEEAERQPWLVELGSDPLAHIEALLRFEALSYATWKLACQQLVDSGDLLLWQNHKGEAAIHPYMEEMDKAAVRWDRVSKHAIDAGVSTKRLAMEEESMGLLAAAARMALAEKALGLPPEVQREALRYLGVHLRSIGPGTGA